MVECICLRRYRSRVLLFEFIGRKAIEKVYTIASVDKLRHKLIYLLLSSTIIHFFRINIL